ncbi:MAG TPA: 50S ribosomal protein L3 [Candidatus Nanoarchaeia archaeon]|nr:50S ribosomal protein L3P [uncultured archaeon]HLC63480.1 50S ribosomal protein L3 [Candidatus Nanoarchaeia archaeon]
MGRGNNRPRRGSLQVWPRKRAKSQNVRIGSWKDSGKTQLSGFAGYKIGMTQISYINKVQGARGRNKELVTPATIIECPPLKLFSIRFYKRSPYGNRIVSEHLVKNPDKHLERRIYMPKQHQEKQIEKYDDIRILCSTQPYLTSLSKKSPELIEIAISGPLDKKLEFAKSLANKEIKASDVLQESQIIDVHAVTKGKGLQGAVKRFGVALKQKKSEKKKRSTGNLGAFTPRKVLFTVAHPGQMGYHTRTEFNKPIIKISNELEKINPKQGFTRYGFIKNEYVLIRGSTPGPSKRLIKMTNPQRNNKPLNIELRMIKK